MRHIKSFVVAFGLFLFGLSGLPLLAEQSAAPKKCFVYVGTSTDARSKGIYYYQMDLDSGDLTADGLAAETPNPTFLDLDPKGRFLFAANEISKFEGKPAGAVSAYSIDADTGKLTFLNERSSVGSGPCHILVDHTGKNALIANYGSGSVAVLPIQANGRLADASAFIQHEGKSINPDRQEKAHAHCMALDAANQFAFACDLGIDKVMIYRFDASAGTLTANQPPFAPIKAGSGPRHLTFGANGRFAYLISELSSTITVFSYDANHGALRELQTVSTLPDDFKGQSTCAEIAVHPSGKFLYGSNRGHDSIAVFAINPGTGTLTFVQRESTQGKTPRYFGIEPNGHFLVAANQDSDNLVLFTINPQTGALTPTGKTWEVGSPMCVKFLPIAAK